MVVWTADLTAVETAAKWVVLMVENLGCSVVVATADSTAATKVSRLVVYWVD
jgi:hypothetical protein